MDWLLAVALFPPLLQATTLEWRLLWNRIRAIKGRPAHPGRRKIPPLPVQTNRRKPQWVVDAIIRLKALQPKASNRVMAAQFNRLYAAPRRMTISSSYVHYTVRENQLAILRKRREMKAQLPSPQPCNAVWGIDMSGKPDTAGKLHMMLGILDHGSRKALALSALPNKTSWTLIGHLCLAIGRYDKPLAIRTDNEAVFTSAIFSCALRLAGIRHQRIAPGCPWQNGRIERFFGTLKQSLDCWQVANRQQLQTALDQFRDWYCAIRPHAHLDSATPDEIWQGIDPLRRAPVRAEWFEAWDGLLTGFRISRR
jgi:transposase InsO family protein